MHPTLRIQLYILSALALPGLNFFLLAVVAIALPMLFRDRLRAMLRLTWRARWLFLLLGIGYAYTLPGVPAWPGLGDYSPSLAGLREAGAHMARLLLLLWLLDVLIVGMATPRLMSGLHGLFAGLAWLGFPAERGTVRLGLTLQAMERNSMALRDLTVLLASPAPVAQADAAYALVHEPWRARDSLILATVLLALLALWFA